jgi:shikimate 5-dehydrogenase
LRELEILKAVDTLLYDEKRGYWPEILFRDALFEYLTHTVKNLDIMQKAFVIGTCGLARATISTMIKLGFSKINITSQDEQSAESLIKDFSEIYFNVQFEYTKRGDVTILPGTHGLVVNTFSALDNDDFPNEIYFFNFLKKYGLVMDLVEIPIETPFLKIAQDIEARVVHGYEALGFYDLLWVAKATGQKLDFEAYKPLLKSHLESVSYDKNKLQKILDEFQI